MKMACATEVVISLHDDDYKFMKGYARNGKNIDLILHDNFLADKLYSRAMPLVPTNLPNHLLI